MRAFAEAYPGSPFVQVNLAKKNDENYKSPTL